VAFKKGLAKRATVSKRTNRGEGGVHPSQILRESGRKGKKVPPKGQFKGKKYSGSRHRLGFKSGGDGRSLPQDAQNQKKKRKRDRGVGEERERSSRKSTPGV